MRIHPVPLADEFGPLTADQIAINSDIEAIREACINRNGMFADASRAFARLANVFGASHDV